MIHIVDDDELILMVLVELSKSFGFQTQQFSSPHDYLAFAGSNEYGSPAAVFCDVMMPEMDGFELMHKVHARHPQARFVMISSSAQCAHQYSHEACIYLIKPIRFAKLEKTFQHLRTCTECGPLHALVNAWPDDREQFEVAERTCPFDSGKMD